MKFGFIRSSDVFWDCGGVVLETNDTEHFANTKNWFMPVVSVEDKFKP